MARPAKKGLDYFPFDVNFFSDRKIKRLKARYGTKGIAVYIYIVCEIYRSGYYIEYNDDLVLDISDELNISEDATTQIIDFLLSRSLFNDKLAKSDKVLTAESVQRRFQEAKKGSKREVEVEARYWLLEAENTDNFIKVRHNKSFSENNSSFSEKNPSKSEKNSTKESKENKSKVNKNILSAKPEPLQSAYMDFIEMRNKIKKPLTDKALQLVVSKVERLSDNIDTQIAIINQSVEHCWQTVYPLNDQQKKERETSFDIDEYEKISMQFLSKGG